MRIWGECSNLCRGWTPLGDWARAAIPLGSTLSDGLGRNPWNIADAVRIILHPTATNPECALPSNRDLCSRHKINGQLRGVSARGDDFNFNYVYNQAQP